MPPVNNSMKALFLSLLVVAISPVMKADWIEPIIAFKEAQPRDAKIFDTNRDKLPIVIKTSLGLRKYLDEKTAKAIAKSVDFSEQHVLVFAWKGSGRDKIEYEVAESYPEQIGFRYQRGRTKDLRRHLRVFAVRKNVRWKSDI